MQKLVVGLGKCVALETGWQQPLDTCVTPGHGLALGAARIHRQDNPEVRIGVTYAGDDASGSALDTKIVVQNPRQRHGVRFALSDIARGHLP